MENITEVAELLGRYVKLEEKIKGIKSQETLKESQDYRSFLNIQHKLNKQVLNGAEIIEIYKSLKNVYDREKNIFDIRYDSMEKEYKEKIENLEEAVSNLRNSKDNLRKLISDPKNFFNGEIIEEIKREIE